MLYEIPEHNKISGETNFPVDPISGKFGEVCPERVVFVEFCYNFG